MTKALYPTVPPCTSALGHLTPGRVCLRCGLVVDDQGRAPKTVPAVPGKVQNQPRAKPPLTAGQKRLARIIERDGPWCYFCREPFSPQRPATTEHLVPKARGGGGGVSNLVAACGPCNGDKGDRTVGEYIDHLMWSRVRAALAS